MAWRSLHLVLWLAAIPLRAQDRSPRLELSLPQQVVAGVDVPTVSFANILSEGHGRELLNAGWPTVLHCRIELLKKSWLFFNSESVITWDLIVEYSPATHRYQVRRQQDNAIEDLGQVSSIDEAEQI